MFKSICLYRAHHLNPKTPVETLTSLLSEDVHFSFKRAQLYNLWQCPCIKEHFERT